METIQKKATNVSALLTLAMDAAKRAGVAIMQIYGRNDSAVDTKSDNSPLTKADKASHQIICDCLAVTGLPILSEEGRNIPHEERKEWNEYWLIDPLDGTKEFIKRNGEFTVNIALMKSAVPIAGVVYAPCLDVLYYGSVETGAYKFEMSDEVVLSTTKENSFQQLLQKASVRIVASRSHSNPETEAFIGQFSNVELVSMGSSLKFMLLAEGAADIYPRLATTMEWDTAAAHAILKAANKKVYHQDLTTELQYNKPDLLNPHFIAF